MIVGSYRHHSECKIVTQFKKLKFEEVDLVYLGTLLANKYEEKKRNKYETDKSK